MKKCKLQIENKDFDLVLCFVDLDDLYTNCKQCKKDPKEEICELEKNYSDIKIIWNNENFEDEIKKVIGKENLNKWKINKLAQQNTTKFIGSKYYKNILKLIKERESELNNN